MLKIRFPWNFAFPLATIQQTQNPRALSRWMIFAWLLTLRVLLWVPGCSAQDTQRNAQNVSVNLFGGDSAEVIYTPFFCNSTTAEANPESCAGAWQSGFSDRGVPIVTSSGRNAATGNILPQIFFRFRASQAYIFMDETSKATINITLSARNITITETVQPSLAIAAIVNLPEQEVTTLTITVLPAPEPVPFNLFAVNITTPLNAASTSIFPTLTLPAPTPISTWFNPTTTSFATSTITMPATGSQPPVDRRKLIALAVGLTVGLGLGLTALLVVAFFYWKKRRRISRLWRRSVSRVDFD